MNIYFIYGAETRNIDLVKNDLERILNVKFELHKSTYWGEYYLAKVSEDQSIRITYNYVDEDWQENEFKNLPVLIELNQLTSLSEVVNKIDQELQYARPLRKMVYIPKEKIREYIFKDGQYVLVVD